MKTFEYRVELPEDIRDLLKDLAAKEGRSLKKELEQLLKDAAVTWKQQNPPDRGMIQ